MLAVLPTRTVPLSTPKTTGQGVGLGMAASRMKRLPGALLAHRLGVPMTRILRLVAVLFASGNLWAGAAFPQFELTL